MEKTHMNVHWKSKILAIYFENSGIKFMSFEGKVKLRKTPNSVSDANIKINDLNICNRTVLFFMFETRLHVTITREDEITKLFYDTMYSFASEQISINLVYRKNNGSYGL